MAERGDFIVSPEGKVVAYEVISSNVGRNAEELLRRVGLPVRPRARRSGLPRQLDPWRGNHRAQPSTLVGQL